VTQHKRQEPAEPFVGRQPRSAASAMLAPSATASPVALIHGDLLCVAARRTMAAPRLMDGIVKIGFPRCKRKGTAGAACAPPAESPCRHTPLQRKMNA